MASENVSDYDPIWRPQKNQIVKYIKLLEGLELRKMQNVMITLES